MTETKSPTTAELAADFEKQSAERVAVDAMLANRDAGRRALLLTGSDAEVDKFDADTLKLERRRARAEARLQAIRDEHKLAAERELEARKVALRTAAEARREAAAPVYLQLETKLQGIIEDLAILFEADQAIAQSNANLPAGTLTPLRPVEADFRWVAALPSRIEQAARRQASNPGPLAGDTGGAEQPAGETVARVIEGRSAVRPDPLYDVIEVPALRPGDQPLRVSGTPLRLTGHSVTKLQPVPPLPDPAAAAATAPAPAGAGPLNVTAGANAA